jgi:transglutaminase superfamily protein
MSAVSPRRRADATLRFKEVVSQPPGTMRLDLALALIAAHHHDVDPDGIIAMLDVLGKRFRDGYPATFDGLRAYLFDDLGYAADVVAYEDPENSMLDRVMARRFGIPITLSIVMIEVGRRGGVEVAPVGMPGHFLVRDPRRPGVFCDPFHAGVLRNVEGCRAIHDALFDGRQRFDERMLSVTPRGAVVARVLANLEHGPLRNDLEQLAWIVRLRASIPGLSLGESLALGAQLERLGMPADAAAVFDRAAAQVSAEEAEVFRRRARDARATFN